MQLVLGRIGAAQARPLVALDVVKARAFPMHAGRQLHLVFLAGQFGSVFLPRASASFKAFSVVTGLPSALSM
jgi:hypothetical protein